MRTTTVPAQVTTVEDRVAGNLTIAQLLILMAGFGLATLVYLFMAPKYNLSPTKLVVLFGIVATIAPLAIRVADKIVAEWLVILTRFIMRPRRYVFTKSDREVPAYAVTDEAAPTTVEAPTRRVQLDTALGSPAVAFRFVPPKKGLHVTR